MMRLANGRMGKGRAIRIGGREFGELGRFGRVQTPYAAQRLGQSKEEIENRRKKWRKREERGNMNNERRE